MNYSEAIKFLYELRLFGSKFGLENTFKLAELCGNPQDELNFIHVAGTNGKGSTCAMLESIYRAAGYKTGLYTSPHLVSFTERIQINRKPIPQAEVVRLVEQMKSVLGKFPSDHLPTFFEVVTVMALVYFCRNECDVVIWETGLGGRLDATNIVYPLASVITNIGLDHQQYLGPTTAHIAAEKAGIIKPNVPVITATDDEDALDVIIGTALHKGSPFCIVTKEDTNHPPLDSIELPLYGEHQKINAALAVATVNTLQKRLPVLESAIIEGLSTVQWAGRFQIINSAQRTFVLDGAHNPHGAKALSRAFKSIYPDAKPAIILGILGDKDISGICAELVSIPGNIFITPVASERTAKPEKIRDEFLKIKPNVRITLCNNLKQAIELTSLYPLTLIAGSLYLVGEAIELLGVSTTVSQYERALNEWKVNPAR